MLSAIDRNHCPPSNGMPVRHHRNTHREIAARYSATPAQIALAWLLRRSPTMLPIPGTLSLEHLKENMAALQLALADEDFEMLR